MVHLNYKFLKIYSNILFEVLVTSWKNRNFEPKKQRKVDNKWACAQRFNWKAGVFLRDTLDIVFNKMTISFGLYLRFPPIDGCSARVKFPFSKV
jgi:hypothetical protein